MMYRMLRVQVGNPFETYIARTQIFHMRPPRLKPRVRRSADYLFIGVVWWFFAISNEHLTFWRPLSWFRCFRNNDGIYFYGLWFCIRSWEIKSGVSSCRSVRWANPFLPVDRMALSSLGKSDGTGQDSSVLMLNRWELGPCSCHLLAIFQTVSRDPGEAGLLPPRPAFHGKNCVCSGHRPALFWNCLGR